MISRVKRLGISFIYFTLFLPFTQLCTRTAPLAGLCFCFSNISNVDLISYSCRDCPPALPDYNLTQAVGLLFLPSFPFNHVWICISLRVFPYSYWDVDWNIARSIIDSTSPRHSLPAVHPPERPQTYHY